MEEPEITDEAAAKLAKRAARRAARVAQALRQVSGTHPVLARTADTTNPAPVSASGKRQTRQSKKQRREARKGR